MLRARPSAATSPPSTLPAHPLTRAGVHGGVVVDVGVAQRAAGHGVAAHADGRDGAHRGEQLEEHGLRHVPVQVAHIQRRVGGRRGRRRGRGRRALGGGGHGCCSRRSTASLGGGGAAPLEEKREEKGEKEAVMYFAGYESLLLSARGRALSFFGAWTLGEATRRVLGYIRVLCACCRSRLAGRGPQRRARRALVGGPAWTSGLGSSGVSSIARRGESRLRARAC